MSRYGGGGGGGRSSGGGAKVYVGNLGNDASKTELERAFGHFGHLRHVWVARNPPGFAFIEFEDPRDAADAVKELDDSPICGQRARVELSSGESRRRGFRGGGGGGGGGFGGRRPPPRDSRCYECGEVGHFARECRRRSGGGGGRSGGGGGRSGGRRSYSRTRKVRGFTALKRLVSPSVNDHVALLRLALMGS